MSSDAPTPDPGGEFADVIDWEEALEQCGDDDEFLRELLGDLRGEVDAQIVKIDEVLKKLKDQPFLLIMRASHVIKGAASNLMCQQLREGAMDLEQAAAAANEMDSDDKALEAATQTVQEKHDELRKAVDKYHEFLESVDI